MDHFGIGPALQALLRVYTLSSRGSGRTTSLLESVCDGDRIICSLHKEKARLVTELRRVGRDVSVVVVSPANPDAVMSMPVCTGRTLFEHTWVEEFYRIALDRAAKDIDQLQQYASRAASLLGTPPIKPKPGRDWLT